MNEYMIPGTDRQDVLRQMDKWLAEHPGIKVIRVHPIRREPPTLLNRISKKRVPRASITVDYEDQVAIQPVLEVSPTQTSMQEGIEPARLVYSD